MRFNRKLLAILCSLSTPVLAWDTPLNPDLRPSFGFVAGESGDVSASQDLTLTESVTGPKGKVISSSTDSQSRNLGGQSGDFFADALFPLTNSLSLQAGGGITSSLNKADELQLAALGTTVNLPATSNDTALAKALLSVRYYFLDVPLTGKELTDNPDHWPSVALTASGNDSIYREQTNTTDSVSTPLPGTHTQDLSLASDVRLPVANAWTILANVSVSVSKTDTPETATTAGDETQLKTITYGGGAKWYWVDHNCIHEDNRQNPDRWISLALTADGTTTANGTDTIDQVNGKVVQREATSGGYSVNTEFRVPVTNNLTFRFGIGGGTSTYQVPQPDAANPASKSTTPSFSGFLGIRGYFL
jgi:hypothetical protein